MEALPKAEWGPGPWHDEPDFLRWRDGATGLPCLIIRHPRFGSLNGYVGIELEAVDRIDLHGTLVHGGVNFVAGSIFALHHPPGMEVLGEDVNLAFYGFDCGHGLDRCPGMEAMERKRFGRAFHDDFPDEAQYRTITYVKTQCARLAAHLAAFRCL
jgi:hypothetical protein